MNDVRVLLKSFHLGELLRRESHLDSTNAQTLLHAYFGIYYLIHRCSTYNHHNHNLTEANNTDYVTLSPSVTSLLIEPLSDLPPPPPPRPRPEVFKILIHISII